jgi:hypothetical protein
LGRLTVLLRVRQATGYVSRVIAGYWTGDKPIGGLLLLLLLSN